MTTRAVRREVTVKASPERAFRFFTEQVTAWWPKEHHVGSAPPREDIIEPRVGGRWYSINEDDSESDIGRVLVWDPFGRLVLAWQLRADWVFDPSFSTEVEVRFEPAGDGRTRVTLEHRQLERFGEKADEIESMIGAESGWGYILRSYAGALESRIERAGV